MATVNGVGYTSVSEALANAASGATVQMIAPSTEKNIIVPAGVTLNLNGQTLTVGSAASFGTIIDSANVSAIGAGKLIVGEYDLAMPANNGNFLPVWEDNGYIFVKVELVQKFPAVAEGIKTTFYNNNVASDEYLAVDMINNAGGNKLSVIARATWTTATGEKACNDFTLTDQAEVDYGTMALSNPGSFFFTISGADEFVLDVVYAAQVGNYVVEIVG